MFMVPKSHRIEPKEPTVRVGTSKPIEAKTGESKQNPNSLRFLIGHIINFFYEGNQKQASQVFEANGRIYKSERQSRNKKKFHQAATSKILRDKDHVEYWHIEAIARSIQMPSASLLAISRAYSLLREDNPNGVKAFATGLRHLATKLEELAESRTISREWLDDVAGGFEPIRTAPPKPDLLSSSGT